MISLSKREIREDGQVIPFCAGDDGSCGIVRNDMKTNDEVHAVTKKNRTPTGGKK
jgi:hypothetical protein